MVDQLGGDLYASPLHWAVRSGHLESVVVLIRAGADPLIKDKEGLNCVMVASAFEHSQCLAYILAKLGAWRGFLKRNDRPRGQNTVKWNPSAIVQIEPIDERADDPLPS